MRLDINLASRPYEDARQFWMRWGTAVAAVGVLTVLLLALTISGWLNARRDHAAISQKKALIAQRDQQRDEAEAFLNRAENRSTRDESQFLNELIERKAFSWIKVLESLEKVMPPRVHLVTISPGLDEDNQLILKMTVAGDSYDRAVELVKRMDESRRFAQTHIVSQSFEQSSNGDNAHAEMIAVYIPEQVGSIQEVKPEAKPKKDSNKPKPPSKSPSIVPAARPRTVAANGSTR